MSSERLDKIKEMNQNAADIYDDGDVKMNLNDTVMELWYGGHVDWLIIQTEVAENSEKEMLDRELSHMALYNENKRLQQALKTIANVEGVSEGYQYADELANSLISIAKSALEENSNG